MPRIRPDMAVGAMWYFGTEEAAAHRLGIGKESFVKLLEGKPIRDATQHKIDAAWKTLSSDQKFSLQYGGEFARALSSKQAAVLRGDNPEEEKFMGRRFAKAVRRFIRRRDRIPKSVGDFIEEVGSP